MANPVVADLSHHNEIDSFDTMALNGTIGIIHKATEGTTYVDDTYHQREEKAKQAGLCWASYHFLRHGNVKDQMINYLNAINPQPGDRVVVDHEHKDVTLTDLKQAVQFLLDYEIPLEVTIYSGHTIKEQLGNKYDPLLAKTSLWIAHYTSANAPTWPKGTWATWSLWQYTDAAATAGVAAACDGNRFNGSEENLRRWFNATPKPVPEPVPEEVSVDISITVPEGVAVNITINGEMLLTKGKIE